MEEELEKIISAIKCPSRKCLNLTGIVSLGATSSHLFLIKREIERHNKVFTNIVLNDVDLSVLNLTKLQVLLEVISAASAINVSMRATHLEYLSMEQMSIVSKALIDLDIVVLDVSEGTFVEFDENRFEQLCSVFHKSLFLQSLYIANVEFMDWSDEFQRIFWNSLRQPSTVENIYVWQDNTRSFSMQTKDYINEALMGNLKLKFIGIYEFVNDPYLNVLEQYSNRNNRLDTCILNKLESLQFNNTISLDRLEQYAEFKIIDWCALLKIHEQHMHLFYNKMLTLFMAVMTKCREHFEGCDLKNKALIYITNQFAVTTAGKILINKAFEVLQDKLKITRPRITAMERRSNYLLSIREASIVEPTIFPSYRQLSMLRNFGDNREQNYTGRDYRQGVSNNCQLSSRSSYSNRRRRLAVSGI